MKIVDFVNQILPHNKNLITFVTYLSVLILLVSISFSVMLKYSTRIDGLLTWFLTRLRINIERIRNWLFITRPRDRSTWTLLSTCTEAVVALSLHATFFSVIMIACVFAADDALTRFALTNLMAFFVFPTNYFSKLRNSGASLIGSGRLSSLLSGIAPVLFAFPLLAFAHLLLHVHVHPVVHLTLDLLLPLGACFLAVQVVVQAHAIHALLCLMGVFLCTTGVYFANGAEYFALVFVLIGQGAVSILFLFAVILIPLRARQNSFDTVKHTTQAVAVTTGLCGFAFLLYTLTKTFWFTFAQNLALLTANEARSVDKLRTFVQFTANDILAFANLYSNASTLFFLITGILLAAMLGSIILATSSTAPESSEREKTTNAKPIAAVKSKNYDNK